MKHFLLIIIVFLYSLSSYSQNVFPTSWQGNYKGDLQIYGVDSVAMKLTMKLSISKKTDSIYQWKMTYIFKGKEDVRDYEVIIKDAKKGHYIIDEKNTILIDAFYKTGIFTSFFSVQDSYIVSTYSRKENDIVFEIVSANGKKPNISGAQKYKNEDIPEVKSYLVNGRQKAILKKID